MISATDPSDNCLTCLVHSACFNKLMQFELEYINQHKTQINYNKGEIICKQGAFANYVMYVADGLAKTYLESVDNKVINLKIIRPSEFVGFSSLCGEKAYNYSSIALTKTKVCLIDNMSFRHLLSTNNQFTIEVMRLYCASEAHTFEKLRSIGHKHMIGRLGDVLLYLCDDKFKDVKVFDYISRKDIADFACLSTESTVRLLTDLANNGIIKTDGRYIEVLNRKSLESISKRG